MIYIKSQQDIAKIKEACKIWKKVRHVLQKKTKPGMKTGQLDQIAAETIKKNGAIPTFFNYKGFPGNICISVNDELIHGIGSQYELKNDDMVTFDIGVTYQKYICDAAFTIVLDKKNEKANAINDATWQCLHQAIKMIHPNVKIGNISNKINEIATKKGYKVIKNYGGHGCGIKLHEDPLILNYGAKNTGCCLRVGMIICLEPMLMTESDKYIVDPVNKWTIKAQNKKLTCHNEHMVLVTKNGYEILTND